MVVKRKAMWCAYMYMYVMRREGLPCTATCIDGLLGTSQGRRHPKLHWLDNVAKWSGRSVEDMIKAPIEREQEQLHWSNEDHFPT